MASGSQSSASEGAVQRGVLGSAINGGVNTLTVSDHQRHAYGAIRDVFLFDALYADIGIQKGAQFSCVGNNSFIWYLRRHGNHSTRLHKRDVSHLTISRRLPNT